MARPKRAAKSGGTKRDQRKAYYLQRTPEGETISQEGLGLTRTRFERRKLTPKAEAILRAKGSVAGFAKQLCADKGPRARKKNKQ